ncbi:MAG: GatB/YqeY domain-containing protein, partial [Acidimicrobiales bacterium]
NAALDTGELDSLVASVIAENPSEWERFVAGDDKVAGFLLGKVMRASGGRANGKLVAEALGQRRSGGG